MRIVLFAKAFALFTVLAMFGVFIAPVILKEYDMTSILLRFVEFEALALALSIITTAVVPSSFGVLKGDGVLVISRDPINGGTMIKLGTALERKKLGETIRINTGEAEAVVATVESYAGIITPARVGIRAEQNIKVI
ncbi:MAG: hypothetical protein WC492_01275 [Candidatus Micrarchaeia archaeon]